MAAHLRGQTRRADGLTFLGCISGHSISHPEAGRALYILHTSIGAITVHKFVYRSEAGYVFLQGLDHLAVSSWPVGLTFHTCSTHRLRRTILGLLVRINSH